MLSFLNNNNLKFKKIANDFQLIINDASDLKSIIKIDPSLWAVTSLPIDGVVFNYDFLKFIDTDNNKKIHPIEFIESLKWLFNILSKYNGISTESDHLSLTALNKDNAEAKAISYTARTINRNLKNKPLNIINLSTVLNYPVDNIDDETFLYGYQLLKKLLLFQRYMIEFANNYVTLDSLYDPHTLSIMQPGYLIIGGNYYTLGAKVTNLQEHKLVNTRSNIYTIYVEINSKNEHMILAFAITNGLNQNLYIGKTGIFIDRRDKSEWDAKIIDIIEQPISIWQVLLTPVLKLHKFILSRFQNKLKENEGKLLDENTETECAKVLTDINEKKELPINSIAIAALGSAGAFIVSALHSISIFAIISFILSIFIILSIPIILLSVFKLQHRSITEFYTASGWSINPKVQLDSKMGIIFTYSPKNSIKMDIIQDDLIKKFIDQFEKEKTNKKKIIIWSTIIVTIILIILFLGNLFFFHFF